VSGTFSRACPNTSYEFDERKSQTSARAGLIASSSGTTLKLKTSLEEATAMNGIGATRNLLTGEFHVLRKTLTGVVCLMTLKFTDEC